MWHTCPVSKNDWKCLPSLKNVKCSVKIDYMEQYGTKRCKKMLAVQSLRQSYTPGFPWLDTQIENGLCLQMTQESAWPPPESAHNLLCSHVNTAHNYSCVNTHALVITGGVFPILMLLWVALDKSTASAWGDPSRNRQTTYLTSPFTMAALKPVNKRFIVSSTNLHSMIYLILASAEPHPLYWKVH